MYGSGALWFPVSRNPHGELLMPLRAACAPQDNLFTVHMCLHRAPCIMETKRVPCTMHHEKKLSFARSVTWSALTFRLHAFIAHHDCIHSARPGTHHIHHASWKHKMLLLRHVVCIAFLVCLRIAFHSHEAHPMMNLKPKKNNKSAGCFISSTYRKVWGNRCEYQCLSM